MPWRGKPYDEAMKPVVAVAACVLTLTLSACGNSDNAVDTNADPTLPTQATSQPTPSNPPSSHAPPVLPKCGEVWKADAKLPGRYLGCTQGATRVKAAVSRCESGQQIVTYDGRFYAVPGRPINDVGDLETSPDYQAAITSCLG